MANAIMLDGFSLVLVLMFWHAKSVFLQRTQHLVLDNLKCRPQVLVCFLYAIHLCALKGCGMGPWLVLVSPCFRVNVVATCKIWSFSSSLDNLLQKNVIVLFFGTQISKWRSFEKKGYF